MHKGIGRLRNVVVATILTPVTPLSVCAAIGSVFVASAFYNVCRTAYSTDCPKFFFVNLGQGVHWFRACSPLSIEGPFLRLLTCFQPIQADSLWRSICAPFYYVNI